MILAFTFDESVCFSKKLFSLIVVDIRGGLFSNCKDTPFFWNDKMYFSTAVKK